MEGKGEGDKGEGDRGFEVREEGMGPLTVGALVMGEIGMRTRRDGSVLVPSLQRAPPAHLCIMHIHMHTQAPTLPCLPSNPCHQNGDTATSKIKQVASGRFGVTPEFLINADQLEIKVAQVCFFGGGSGKCDLCGVGPLQVSRALVYSPRLPLLLVTQPSACCSTMPPPSLPPLYPSLCRVPSPGRAGSCPARRCPPTLPPCAAPSPACPSSPPLPTTTSTPSRIWRS